MDFSYYPVYFAGKLLMILNVLSSYAAQVQIMYNSLISNTHALVHIKGFTNEEYIYYYNKTS